MEEFDGRTLTDYVCQDMKLLKGRTSFMTAMRLDTDFEYYPVEMYKTADCTGVAQVNGL